MRILKRISLIVGLAVLGCIVVLVSLLLLFALVILAWIAINVFIAHAIEHPYLWAIGLIVLVVIGAIAIHFLTHLLRKFNQ
jgi:hypothetical protein